MADPWNLTFSPDGERLVFFIGTQLHTVSIFGGQPESLYDAQDFVEGISWGSEGDILLSLREGLMRVLVSTREATLVVPAKDDGVFLNPFHLPNGTHALVSVGQPGDGGRLAVVDLSAGTQIELPLQGDEPIYSPTGHIVFRQSGELFACRFDIASLEVVGSAVAVASGVAYGPRLSDDGTLVYVADRAQGSAGLVWVNREGIIAPIAGERRDYLHIDLSDDGTQALLQVQGDIYASDISRGSRRLVSRGGMPIWHPDGERASFIDYAGGIVTRMADGSGEEWRRVETIQGIPTSWSPDGEHFAFEDASDVWIASASGDAQPFLTGPANERAARFSPDGSALAYTSDESGEFQIYVTPFPGPGPKVPVSIDGGLSPSSDGTELYFRQGSKVMMANISLSPEIVVSPPEFLFDGPYTLDLSGHQRYDVAPDGRFLMVENSEDFRVVVVEGFFEELKRLVPVN